MPVLALNKIYWFIINLSRSNFIFRNIVDFFALVYYKIFRVNRCFEFQGEPYKYFYHLYNRTVAGERIVEIPIVKRKVDEYQSKSILEVGNVLSHYFDIKHDILDKYEKAPGVINEDAMIYDPPKRYDLIVSISTLEHVGLDYGEEYSPEKFNLVLNNLKRLLSRNGQLFITLPISFNPYLQKLIMARKMSFTNEFYLQRSSFLNDWCQIPFAKVKKLNGYDNYYANANCIFIGQFFKK